MIDNDNHNLYHYACSLTIGIVFQSEKVPLMKTLSPPPSHLNTVGRIFDCCGGLGVPCFTPSEIVEARARL